METLAPVEWAAHLAWRWQIGAWEKAPGTPVLVLPGLGMPDMAMAPMRAAMERLGYCPEGWGMGVNTGPSVGVLKQISQKISALADKHSQPVAVVGWSLGGAMGRAAAAHTVKDVRCVVAFGSPMGKRVESHLDGAFEILTGLAPNDKRFSRWMDKPLPGVPVSSIVSQDDGLLAWESGVLAERPLSETIVVRGISHLGMPAHPVVLGLIHDRLLQSPDQWKPYTPDGAWERAWLATLASAPAPRPRRRGMART